MEEYGGVIEEVQMSWRASFHTHRKKKDIQIQTRSGNRTSRDFNKTLKQKSSFNELGRDVFFSQIVKVLYHCEGLIAKCWESTLIKSVFFHFA